LTNSTETEWYPHRTVRRNPAEVDSRFVKPRNLWENGYNESFNSEPRDEVLNREIFHTLAEAQALIEVWRIEYNSIRPHSALVDLRRKRL